MSEQIEKAFTKFFDSLISILPMNDTVFIARLNSAGLLTEEMKCTILTTERTQERAGCFLKFVLEANKSDHSSIQRLITVMEESADYPEVQELALEMKIDTRVVSKHGTYTIYSFNKTQEVMLLSSS